MDLPFQDSADTAATRATVLDELERSRALFRASLRPEGDGVFEWWCQRHWTDRRRWLALPYREVAPFLPVPGLPEGNETEALLDFYGGDGRRLDAIDVIDVFAWLVAGTLSRHSWLPSVTQTFNLVVVAPLIDAASGPLFWVALATVLGSDAPTDLMDVMRPMTFDMSCYPESRTSAATVRRAQAAFVGRWAPDLVPAVWPTLDDAAWAAVCVRLVGVMRHTIEANVFELVDQRARAIRAGLRPS